jgi:hypothetical protein
MSLEWSSFHDALPGLHITLITLEKSNFRLKTVRSCALALLRNKQHDLTVTTECLYTRHTIHAMIPLMEGNILIEAKLR